MSEPRCRAWEESSAARAPEVGGARPGEAAAAQRHAAFASGAYVLGFDIGGTKTSVTLAHPSGRVEVKRTVPTAPQEGFERAFARICAAGDEVVDEARRLAKPVGWIGVSIGGPLDVEKGIIYSPPNLPGWDAIPLRRLLEERYGTPAVVEHDGLAGALAERRFGAAVGLNHVIFLTLGTGLGAGLILNGRPYRGAGGSAGNVGHVRVADDGPNIWNKPGCWESFSSGAGIAALSEWRFPGHFPVGATAKEIAEKARTGDPAAGEVLRTAAEYLGRGLAMLMDIFNPEMIVLGSLGVRLQDLLLERALEVAEREALAEAWRDCRVVPSKLGERIDEYAPLAAVLERLGIESVPAPERAG